MREKMPTMFSAEQLEQREMQEVALDNEGVSEAYFPLWGILNVDGYLQKSDAFRLKAVRLAEEEARAEEMRCAAEEEARAEAAAGSGDAVVGGSGAAIGGEGCARMLRGPRSASATNSFEVAAGAGDGGASVGARASADADTTVAPAARVAWGAWFWVKRVVVALVVCVVGSLLVTMALNPSMTFFDAAQTLFEGVSGLIGGVFHG